jgi:hypothetical protein
MAKKAPTPAVRKADPDGYRINGSEWGFQKGATDSHVLAALSTRSAMTANTYKAYASGGDKLEVTDLIGELRKAGDEVANGNLSRVESMLTHQALTLDAIFNDLAQRSRRQDNLKSIEVLMRLALKAQAQSRSTVEAIALLKNPMPYIKQANVTSGPQQVNNYGAASSGSGIRPGAENFQSKPNKLLEADHGQRLDNGAPAAAGRADQALAAVGAVHRAGDT